MKLFSQFTILSLYGLVFAACSTNSNGNADVGRLDRAQSSTESCGALGTEAANRVFQRGDAEFTAADLRDATVGNGISRFYAVCLDRNEGITCPSGNTEFQTHIDGSSEVECNRCCVNVDGQGSEVEHSTGPTAGVESLSAYLAGATARASRPTTTYQPEDTTADDDVTPATTDRDPCCNLQIDFNFCNLPPAHECVSDSRSQFCREGSANGVIELLASNQPDPLDWDVGRLRWIERCPNQPHP